MDLITTNFQISQGKFISLFMQEKSDLWKRFKDGSDHAFYLLYDQYADPLYKYGIHFSKDKELIKDCIHDLFLDLYKYRKNLTETDNIKFYLFRSLRRIIHKEQVKVIPLRSDPKIYIPEESLIFSHEDYLIVAETEAEDHKHLHDAMKTLSNHQREALSLKFEHDQPYAEIAEIMGISVESARTLIYRSLKELRKCIEGKSLSMQLLIFLTRKNL